MLRKKYTVEELMSDDSFLNYCLHNHTTDKEFWDKQIALYADQQAVFTEARYMIGMLFGKLDEEEINRQIEKVKQQIRTGFASMPAAPGPGTEQEVFVVEVDGPVTTVTKSKRKYVLYGLAACMLTVLSVYLFRNELHSDAPTKIIASPVIYSSGMGERKNVVLPDGSAVILNSNSSVSFTDDFNTLKRELILKGEAFFQVAKDPTRPFIVHSGDFSTTALGTAFYVHAGGVCNTYEVDLIEGKVQLGNTVNAASPQNAVLLPGQSGRWEQEGASFSGSNCDTMALRQWVLGRLSFRKMPAVKVFSLLAQWYSVNISAIDNKWDDILLTGDYSNESLENVLKIVCFSLSCHYRYVNDRVIIEQ